MTPETRELLEARPFTPFYIHTSGANRYGVATPDHAGFGPGSQQVIIWFDDRGSMVLSGLHFVGVEREAEKSEQTV